MTAEESAYFQKLTAALGANATNTAGESRYPGEVYMGAAPPIRVEGIGYIEPKGEDRYRWVSGEEAEVEYNSWTPKERQDFIAKAKVAGLIQIDGGDVEGGRIWRELVKEASYFGVKKSQRVTPWDLLNGYIKGKGGSGPLGEWQKDTNNPDFEVNVLTGARRYVGPRFKTVTSNRVDMTDPATAAAIATRVFQDLMGRNPGKGELEGFSKALSQAEMQSPISTTTTVEFDPATGEQIGQTALTEGGLDAAGKAYLAEQNVKKTKEYGAVQSATTYSNAVENAVWGAPQIGG